MACDDDAMVSATGLAEGEHLVLKVHQHWKTVLRPVLVFALIVVVLLVVLIFAAPVRHAAAPSARPLLRWWTTSYELTNRRLRLRAGIISRTGRDFPLTRISDVSFAQGLLDRMLGCGRLVVESPGEHGQLILSEIPHVQQVQATLFQLVEDEQERLTRDNQGRSDI
jgi:uncharacterized membrane protein YdbT with pleckstrin-like domain